MGKALGIEDVIKKHEAIMDKTTQAEPFHATYENAMEAINAGEIQNQGVEIALNARALQIKDFAWD